MCFFFFPPLFKSRHLEAFRYWSLQLFSLYLLCSGRPYGGRLVYYLSISSAGPVGLCLATTAAGRAEFNWKRVGFGRESGAIVFHSLEERPHRFVSGVPRWKAFEERRRAMLRPDSLKDTSIGITAFIDYCRIHFFLPRGVRTKWLPTIIFPSRRLKTDASVIWKIDSKHQLLVPYARHGVFISDWHLPDSGRAKRRGKREVVRYWRFLKINRRSRGCFTAAATHAVGFGFASFWEVMSKNDKTVLQVEECIDNVQPLKICDEWRVLGTKKGPEASVSQLVVRKPWSCFDWVTASWAVFPAHFFLRDFKKYMYW